MRFAGITPKGLRDVADRLTDGIIVGHDWPNTQDELTRLDAARVLRWLASQHPAAFQHRESGEFCSGGMLAVDLPNWIPLYDLQEPK